MCNAKKIVFRIRYDIMESLVQAGITSRQRHHLRHTLPGFGSILFVLLVHSEPCSSRVVFFVLVMVKINKDALGRVLALRPLSYGSEQAKSIINPFPTCTFAKISLWTAVAPECDYKGV